ncbi:MAG: phosphonate ABC transporter substrate-binding protein [Planctomycetes bacterium]|nr:phosphonate ABC transporter substrate-binding protein [Planctomycetota bacterium]
MPVFRNLAIAALAFAAGIAHAADEPKALNFGIISTESQANLRPSWDPFLADMAKAVGVPVNAFFASDYSGVIEAQRFKKVDIAWYGNKSAISAVDRADGEVFCQVVNLEGQAGYWSYIVVHKDSGLKTVDDILGRAKDLTFSMGDPQSTSGTLVPGYYVFAQRGIDAKTAFKRLTNAKHEANALAVLNRQVDAATMASDVYDRMNSREPEKVAQLHVAWKSPLLPSDPMVWRKDLPEGMKAKLKDFFVGYGKTPEQKAVIEKLKWSAFRASDNSQLIPIRELELAKKRAEAQADDKLAADEKAKKIAEIDAQLGELRKAVAK